MRCRGGHSRVCAGRVNDTAGLVLPFDDCYRLSVHLVGRYENHRIFFCEKTDVAGVDGQHGARVGPYADFPSRLERPLENEEDPGENVGGNFFQCETDWTRVSYRERVEIRALTSERRLDEGITLGKG